MAVLLAQKAALGEANAALAERTAALKAELEAMRPCLGPALSLHEGHPDHPAHSNGWLCLKTNQNAASLELFFWVMQPQRVQTFAKGRCQPAFPASIPF